MVSLCIDQGNSYTKLVLFEDDSLVGKFSFKRFGIRELCEFCEECQPDAAILGSVVRCDTLAREMKGLFRHFVYFTPDTRIPIRNGYAQPATLGRDRLASAVGAAALLPGRNLLVIDAGSAITYDVVRADGTFVGGNIAPGKRLRLNSLHDYTDRLPNVIVHREDAVPVLGNTTETAIRAGVVQGIAREMDGYCRWMEQTYGDYSVLLTGGDGPIFLPLVEHEMRYEEMLVPWGLKRILDYNA